MALPDDLDGLPLGETKLLEHLLTDACNAVTRILAACVGDLQAHDRSFISHGSFPRGRRWAE
jgi:hypothetical protein